MNKKERRDYFIFGIIIVVAVVALILIFSGGEKVDNKEVIKIGIAAPLTGGVAYQGERFIDGATLAAQEYNANNNKKISLTIEDDQCSASKAISVSNKIIDLDGIDKVVSYCGASSTPYADKLRNEGGIMFVSSVRLSIAEEKDPFLFNLLPPPKDEMDTLSKYLISHNFTKVSVIYQQDFFGQTYLDKFRNSYEGQGGDIILVEGTDSNTAVDFRTSLTKIKSTKSQAIINFVAHPGNYDLILKNSEEVGVGLPFFSEWITEHPSLIDLAGERAEGIIYTHPFKKLNTSKFNQFYQEYVSEYNEEPNIDSVNGYEVVMLFGQLYEDCGDNSRCMEQKLNSGKSYEGLGGDISFKKYMKEGDYYLKTISGGKFVALEE